MLAFCTARRHRTAPRRRFPCDAARNRTNRSQHAAAMGSAVAKTGKWAMNEKTLEFGDFAYLAGAQHLALVLHCSVGHCLTTLLSYDRRESRCVWKKPMSQEAKLQELAELRARVEQLEAEVRGSALPEQPEWPPREFYTAYFVLAGFTLGGIAAMTSLLFNVIGSLSAGQHPLHLIQIYLTFPLGEPALKMESGLALAVGCCLYLLTGMVFGIPFHLVLSRWFDRSDFVRRFMITTAMALALWLLNNGILAWLQPSLCGGDWIVKDIPWWVAAATHLVFGWTMLLLQPLGRFVAAR